MSPTWSSHSARSTGRHCSRSVELSSEKMQKRFKKVLREKGREIFEAGKFNLELFQYVIDEYYKHKQEQEDLEKQQAGEDEQEDKGWVSSMFGAQASVKGRVIGWSSLGLALVLMGFMIYSFFPSSLFSLTN